ENDPALVRRLGCGVDCLRTVFPTTVAARVPVRALVDSIPATKGANDAASRPTGGELAHAARHPQHRLEAGRRRRSHAAHFRPPGRNYRATLLSAIDHGPSGSGL